MSAITGVALVTGGTGTLGQATTLRLLAEGADVCVPWVVAEERDRLVAALSPADQRRVTLEECDVTNPPSMAAFVERIMKRQLRLDVLVTTVGGFAGGSLVETDFETWKHMLDLNLTSTFVALRAVVPSMKTARRGRVVTVASRAVVPPAAGFLAYTVSKSGVIALTKALAEELRGTGVTVNTVLPSTMDTPANRRAMPDADPKQWVPVESVAAAIASLVRDDAGHITGTLLEI